MSITAISAALSSFKSLQDLVKDMINLRDVAMLQPKMIEFQSKVLEIQGQFLAAQEDLFASQKRIDSLEKEVTALKTWEAEKKRYELKGFEFGSSAYALKPEMQASEHPHLLCTSCFEKGQKSILQGMAELESRRRVYVCPTCKAKIYLLGAFKGHTISDHAPS